MTIKFLGLSFPSSVDHGHCNFDIEQKQESPAIYTGLKRKYNVGIELTLEISQLQRFSFTNYLA
jgi:hypothetical protein